jgi:predicted RecB family nuclease
MADNDTEESSPVVKQDNTNEIKTSSPDLEIQDIQGIGPTTAKKLKEAGIVSVMDLAVTSADALAVDINASKESAAAFIMAAQKLLRDSHIIEKEFVTADLALEVYICKSKIVYIDRDGDLYFHFTKSVDNSVKKSFFIINGKMLYITFFHSSNTCFTI